MKEDLVARYRLLISSVASVDHLVREGVEHYRAKWLLVDGSSLRISEVWIAGKLTKYSHYWLDEKDTLIAGWDNAPHHPEIKSHPHHTHAGQEVHESSIRKLDNVLSFLASRILG